MLLILFLLYQSFFLSNYFCTSITATWKAHCTDCNTKESKSVCRHGKGRQNFPTAKTRNKFFTLSFHDNEQKGENFMPLIKKGSSKKKENYVVKNLKN